MSLTTTTPKIPKSVKRARWQAQRRAFKEAVTLAGGTEFAFGTIHVSASHAVGVAMHGVPRFVFDLFSGEERPGKGANGQAYWRKLVSDGNSPDGLVAVALDLYTYEPPLAAPTIAP